MTFTQTVLRKVLSTLVIACAMGMMSTLPASAQSAKKLNCKGCVKSKQIKNNGIGSKDIKDGQVTNLDLANNAVTSDKIATGAVGADEIAAGAVTADEIAADAVRASEIATGAVTPSRLANDAKPAGADSASAGLFGDINLAAADAIIASVTITAPAAGRVIVNASGFFDFNAVNGDARCSVTTGNTIFSILHIRATGGSGIHRYVPMAQTRAFTVAGEGSVTYNLVCDELSGNVQIADVSMTAFYVPQAY